VKNRESSQRLQTSCVRAKPIVFKQGLQWMLTKLSTKKSQVIMAEDFLSLKSLKTQKTISGGDSKPKIIKIVADSGEGYTSKQNLKKGMASLVVAIMDGEYNIKWTDGTGPKEKR